MESQPNLVQAIQPLGRHLPVADAASAKPPIRVAITGAAGQIGGYLCHFVAQGRMFGPYQKVILHLVELPFAEKMLKGLCMELQDSAYRCVAGVVPSLDVNEGFKDIDVAILVGARPRGPGMERKDLLEANAKIFEAQGKALDSVAKKSVKVLVVGNPCNTNALITSTHAPSIPKKNITAMVRLDQMRSLGQISEKLSCDVSDIENICIWGNHSATQFPDTTFATVKGEKLTDKCDKEYLEGEFITKVAKRGAEIISVMDKSSCASAAAAICEHMHDWWFGNQLGGWVSMGVQVEGGRYGVDGDLVFGYPCNVGTDGEWSIVEGLELNDFQKGKIDATMKELQEERQLALGR